MDLTELDTKALRTSFDLALAQPEVFWDRYFNLLLTNYPALRGVFESFDMKRLKKEFGRGVKFVLHNLDNPERLAGFLGGLGQTGQLNWLEPLHLEWFKAALIQTLEETIPDHWHEDLGKEWENLCWSVAAQMRAALAAAAPPRSSPEPVHLSPAPEAKIVLPEAMRQRIRDVVAQALREAVQEEVKRAVEEQMEDISTQGIHQLLKKVV